MAQHEKPPLGKYLEWLRNSYTPPISMRGAADLSGLSEARWRQIENGYRVAAKGLSVPVEPPPQTVVQMVYPLAGSPADLRRAGQGEAADLLDERMARERRDMDETSGVADALASAPDDLFAAEVVRRLFAGRSDFRGATTFRPALATNLIRLNIRHWIEPLPTQEERDRLAREAGRSRDRDTEPRLVEVEPGVWELPSYDPESGGDARPPETLADAAWERPPAPPGQSEESDT